MSTGTLNGLRLPIGGARVLIETREYVAVIRPVRVVNRHDRVMFHYQITRRHPISTLMVSGSAQTEEEASDVVRKHLSKFAGKDAEVRCAN